MNSYKHLANSVGIGGCTQNARRTDYMSRKKRYTVHLILKEFDPREEDGTIAEAILRMGPIIFGT